MRIQFAVLVVLTTLPIAVAEPVAFVAVAFIAALLVGSFLNVVAVRFKSLSMMTWVLPLFSLKICHVPSLGCSIFTISNVGV